MRKFISNFTLCLSILLFTHISTQAVGVLDRTFGPNGRVATSVGASAKATAVVIQPDGKILALGTIGTGDATDTVLVRFNANGSLDANFGTGGIVVLAVSPLIEQANDLGLQSDGKIIVAGNFYSPVSESVDFSVVRFDQNGALDASFGTNGVASVNQSSIDIFYAVAIQPDDKIVAVGTTSQNGYDFAAIRFNPNGSIDQGFSNGGLFFLDLSPFHNNQNFRAVKVLPNGRILIGGTALNNGGVEAIVSLESNGTLAQDFGIGGIRETFLGSESPGSGFDLALLPDGKFMSVSRSFLRRYQSDGITDPTFRTTFASSAYDVVPLGTDLVMRSDGRFIVLNQRSSSSLWSVVYDNNGRDIHRVRFLSGEDIAIQNDDKFVVISASGNDFNISRFVSINSPATRIADFDYDEKTDLAVSRLGQIVYVLRSSQSITSYDLNRSSGEGVRPIPEDYYSNDPGQFPLYYWRSSGQNNPAYFDSITEFGNMTTYQWGMSGDKPVGGDYDGETRMFNSLFRKPSDLAVFRPLTGEWWVFNRFTNTYFVTQWGTEGDKPVPADYDYDGITDFAVYRPSTGEWWILRSSDGGYSSVPFGIASDIPLTGDFDGDGKADLTVYRPSEGNWYQFLTMEGFRVVHFGIATDRPVPGDYDGDGRHDIAVFRDGVWYLLQSTEGLKIVQWGTSGDSPLAVRYDQ